MNLTGNLFARSGHRQSLRHGLFTIGFAQLHRHFHRFPLDRIHPVNHHLAHAASAAYTSGWNECLVVVNDAMGDQSLTVYAFLDGTVKKLREISASDSIGILYSLITLHLGFDFNSDEYKIMGLAPYGDPSRFRAFFRTLSSFAHR